MKLCFLQRKIPQKLVHLFVHQIRKVLNLSDLIQNTCITSLEWAELFVTFFRGDPFLVKVYLCVIIDCELNIVFIVSFILVHLLNIFFQPNCMYYLRCNLRNFAIFNAVLSSFSKQVYFNENKSFSDIITDFVLLSLLLLLLCIEIGKRTSCIGR